MRVTSKGQVTIPVTVRRALGIEPGSEVDIVASGDHAELRPTAARLSRGEQAVALLKGSWQSNLTTDELMQMTRGEG